MKRLNSLAVACSVAFAASGAFAASPWGSSGEASYEEHQAQPVSLYSRAEVQDAYLMAASGGLAWRTAEAVAESPAELAISPTMPRDLALAQAQLPQPETVVSQAPLVELASAQTPVNMSYAAPPDSAIVATAPLAPLPSAPDDPLQATPDMISGYNQDLGLAEGEELVASGEPSEPPVQ